MADIFLQSSDGAKIFVRPATPAKIFIDGRLKGDKGDKGDTGPAGLNGATGPQGPAGSTIRTGAGAPSNSIGANGDYYVNVSDGELYLKINGVYDSVGNIKGPQGEAGLGFPAAGTTGQILQKLTNDDYNTAWVDIPVQCKIYPVSIGNGTLDTFNIDHNFGTKDVIVQVFKNSDGSNGIFNIVRSTNNRVVINFGTPPTSNEFRVLVVWIKP